MTTLYFIRHCESDIRIQDEALRPLTEKGLRDQELVNRYLADKNIDVVTSSPYKRAYDTVSAFADTKGLEIITIEALKERKIPHWVEDFKAYTKDQWADFSYTFPEGESLSSVQTRTLAETNHLLTTYCKKNIAIGCHGTSLCTLIHYYKPDFGYKGFETMAKKMPWA